MTHLGADFDIRPTGRSRGGGLVGGLEAKQCKKFWCCGELKAGRSMAWGALILTEWGLWHIVACRLVKEMKGREQP